jgi:plastocyanin
MLRTRLFLIAAALAAGAGPAHAATVRILMQNLVIKPAVATASVGDTVEWINDDWVDHTATAGRGGFDVFVPAKQSTSIVLTRAGTVEYFSRFHPIMKGRLRIRPLGRGLAR